ncbi:hypothetical protein HUT06_32005 [Actinomadura sp. NAK00032]|uniref:hypothetical protein n=1 Tax=Actinomadura sp. NAK00032 TaxID=2742128 RepID=UPI0015922D0A|nr:hypothetical protein [Actinomadura sp. NAK00032]QKW38057.1 hypothetical protein HUT06_32005 [Actinomadura sp. NAK00032]
MRTLRFAAALAAAASVPLLATPAHAEPAIGLDRTAVKPGQTVTVRLTGFAPGNLLVELCGNQARRGTADCAVAASASTYAGEGKATAVMLNVAKPPVGCPCVIAVRPVTGGAARTVPIKVAGVPTLSAAERPAASAAGGTRRLSATAVSVRGGGLLDGWLGGAADRTLRVTLRNEGTTPLTDVPLSLTMGRGPDPADLVTAPALGTLDPGQERTYDIPFTLGAPAFGRYTVRGEIGGLDEPIAFTAHTAGYPWALPLLGALLVPLPLAARRRRPRPRPASAARQPRGMNENVAANIAWWTRARGHTPEALADALTVATGRPYTAADLPPATPACSFDADTLEAVSTFLGIPLPALLLPAPAGAQDEDARLTPRAGTGPPSSLPT